MLMPLQPNEKNRQFICPCQKSYFSYAALFTHIKQKHNGKAPGAITKPKAQNKRGRPRKYLSEEKRSSSEECKHIFLGNTNLNHSNQFNIINNNDYLFKLSPGSQFKEYKGEHESLPTHTELPQPINYSLTLLEDLANNLYCISPYQINAQTYHQIDAYRLFQSQCTPSPLVNCLQRFIAFAKQGLPQSIASQIKLLVILLLEHVYQANNKENMQSLSHIDLNEYIDTFFQKLSEYTHRWSMQDIIIFQNLNPMKILVVLYNWINTLYDPCQSQFYQQQDK